MFRNSSETAGSWAVAGFDILRRLSAVCLLAGMAIACVPTMIERKLNTVVPDAVAPKPSDIGKELFVVDLHSDSLLWDRDLLKESDYGHVDLPRLISGNVALQVFSVVTKTPLLGTPEDRSQFIPEVRDIPGRKCIDAANFNLSGALYVAQLRPPVTWFDLEARAMNQARRLRGFVAQSGERRAAYLAKGGDAAHAPPAFVMVKTAGDLEQVIKRRRNGENIVGALLALEGAHWIEGGPSEVAAGVGRLFDAGFRMAAPTHRYNNALGASSEGCDQLSGLTEAGKTFLRQVEARHMIVDLAHASDKGILEGADQAGDPVVISHTGVRFDCPQDGDPKRQCKIERGMTAEGVRAVARTGGIVGIGYWPQAVGPGVKRIASTFQSTLEVLSDEAFKKEMMARYGRYEPSEHLALGSDYDGAVEVPFDVSGLGILFAELMQKGDCKDPLGEANPEQSSACLQPADKETLRRIAGGNACRVFATRLPGGSAERAREICAAVIQGE